MGASDEPELQIVEVLEPTSAGTEEQIAVAAPADAFDAAESIRTTSGGSALLKRWPSLGEPNLWHTTAYFSLDRLSGRARPIRVAGEPGARIGVNGGILTGTIAPPSSTRVLCDFGSPSRAVYSFNVRLVNFAGPIPAQVEVFIDDRSLGTLEVSGVTNRSFVARVGPGDRTFQVREVSGGPWIFLSLTVWWVPEVAA